MMPVENKFIRCRNIAQLMADDPFYEFKLKEIAELMDVTTITITSDIKLLREAGMSIYTRDIRKGRGKGWERLYRAEPYPRTPDSRARLREFVDEVFK